ncbi:MAG: heme NO-binding domain-containing protein [Gemmatimonadetes bacterium]|nr:heme NO-binding domain-containing protein [Gemmatimonadota bacterium]
MHGIIFAELKKYVDARLGADAWRPLLREAGLGSRIYVPVRTYPDEEVVALVSAASRTTGLAPAAILEDFGEFIAPDLIGMYRSLIRAEWRTLDFIANTEQTIHKVVRLNDSQALPPEIACTRSGSREVVVHYNSPRRMCAVARGIIRGVAAHYGEQVVVTEPRCMHRGDPACEISVALA